MTQLTTEQAMEIAGELLRSGDAARAAELRRFAIDVLERHLEGRLMTARVLARG